MGLRQEDGPLIQGFRHKCQMLWKHAWFAEAGHKHEYAVFQLHISLPGTCYLFSFSSMSSWSLSSGHCTTLTRTGRALWSSLRTSCTRRSSLHISDMTSWFMSFMPSSSSSVSVPEGTSEESTWETDLTIVTTYKPVKVHRLTWGCPWRRVAITTEKPRTSKQAGLGSQDISGLWPRTLFSSTMRSTTWKFFIEPRVKV